MTPGEVPTTPATPSIRPYPVQRSRSAACSANSCCSARFRGLASLLRDRFHRYHKDQLCQEHTCSRLSPHTAEERTDPRDKTLLASLSTRRSGAGPAGDDRSVKIKSLEAAKIMKIKWLEILDCIEADFRK